jgi:STE24 endopeptidase
MSVTSHSSEREAVRHTRVSGCGWPYSVAGRVGARARDYADPVGDARSLFSAEQIERARAYHRPLYLAWPVGLAVDLGILTAIAFSRVGDALFDSVAGLPWWAQTLTFSVLVIGITTLATLPLSLWSGFVHERAWGFSTQSARGWAADRAKGLCVGLVLGSAALLGLVAVARALPRWWPLVAGAAAAALVVLLGFVAPVIVEPLFNRFTPLQDQELVESLRRLADDAGVPIEQVLVADASRRTTKQNAYVSGFGRTRRLVLYDTLVAAGDPRQLSLVLAHELGHRRAGHLVKGTALGVAGAVTFVLALWLLLRRPSLLGALGVDGAGDPQVVAFVLLLGTCLHVVGAPLGAAVSRRWERQADRISLELTADPEIFEQMHRKLAHANLADLDPPRPVYLALFSHPTPTERIGAARTFTARRTGPAGS